MSTRALYTFIGNEGDQNWNVYKHSDGYPTGAANTLAVAQAWFAWKEPRYESDEFAAAFIAAGKAWAILDTKEVQPKEQWEKYAPGGDYNVMSSGGGVRLMPQGDPTEVAKVNCADIQYRYEIFQHSGGKLWIKAIAGNWWHDEKTEEKTIIECQLADFPAKAKKYEKVKQKA